MPEENTNRLFIEVQGDSTGSFQLLHTSLSPSLSPPVSPRTGTVAIPNPLFKCPTLPNLTPLTPLKHSSSDTDIRASLQDNDLDAKRERREIDLKKSVDTNDFHPPPPGLFSPTMSSGVSLLPAGIVNVRLLSSLYNDNQVLTL